VPARLVGGQPGLPEGGEAVQGVGNSPGDRPWARPIVCGMNSAAGLAARWAATRSRSCPGRAAGLMPRGLRLAAALSRQRA